MALPTYNISADQISDLLPAFALSKRVPLFMGKPGTAKTAMVRHGASRMSARIGKPVAVRELHLASVSEVDIRGYLVPAGDKAIFTKPEFWTDVEANEYGILFLDEFMQATHEVQKAVAPLLLEGRIGEYRLPPGWSVVLAGNGLDDGAGANTLLSHIINRVVLINVNPPDVDEWAFWAAEAQLPHELIAFAKYRPDVVFNADIPAAPNTPYCTPRSLHALGDISKAIPGGLRGMVDSRSGMAVISGTIGGPAASELCALVRTTINLPSFDDVVADPEGTKVPTKPDEAYAMVMLAAVRANMETKDAAITYLSRFQTNFAVTGMVSLVKRSREFATSKPMVKWIMANRDVLAKFNKYISEAL